MIKTTNLQRAFTTEEVRTIALNGVNIEIGDGEFVAIMGPSGCGKTTLLNILGLLDAPTNGEYLLDGEDVSHLSEPQRDRLRKGLIGFVFQSFNLIDDLTVEENIELPLLYMRLPKAGAANACRKPCDGWTSATAPSTSPVNSLAVSSSA